jgi:hypothetical protein
MKRWSRIKIISAEPTLARLPVAQRAEVVHAMERQHRFVLHWLPPLVSIPVGIFCAAVFAFIVLSSNFKSVGGVLGVAVVVYGGAIVVLAAAAGEIYATALRRTIRKHINQRLCFWCGHSLMGLSAARTPRALPLITCPECGRESVVASSLRDE